MVSVCQGPAAIWGLRGKMGMMHIRPLAIRVGSPEEVTFITCWTLETLKAAKICKNATIVELQIL